MTTKIKRKHLDVLSVPVIKCKGCGEFIVLGNTYWNINDVDISAINVGRWIPPRNKMGKKMVRN